VSGRIRDEVTSSVGALAAVFRNPGLRNLELSWGALSIATWSYMIALSVYAFDFGGATAVGIVALIRLLPGAIVSPLAGLVSDKHSRRAVLCLSTTLATSILVASAITGLTGGPAIVVFALAGLFTVASTPFLPAEAALLPQLSRTPQELAAANLTKNLMDNGGFLIGSIGVGIALGIGSTATGFAFSAVAALGSFAATLGLAKDRRPDYARGIVAKKLIDETLEGFRLVIGDASLRLPGAMVGLLALIEGAADVLIVVTALDLLDLSSSSVGYLNAAWGIGGLAGGAILAVILNRGHLIRSALIGAILIGFAFGLPAVAVVAIGAYAGFFFFGVGHSFVDVAANTLLQRVGDDESLGRVRGSLESVRLGAMALGSILVPALVALTGIRWTLAISAVILPAYLILRNRRLNCLELGAPLDERHYELLKASPIFSPLPVATLERLCHEVVERNFSASQSIITEGEPGDCFYLIERGEVEVFEGEEFKRTQGPGEGFGEIALLHDVTRTASVRTKTETALLSLDRDHFLEAVTGHSRARESAHLVARQRLGG
jgi:MFS family permease